jgi:hypothetical protein
MDEQKETVEVTLSDDKDEDFSKDIISNNVKLFKLGIKNHRCK